MHEFMSSMTCAPIVNILLHTYTFGETGAMQVLKTTNLSKN